MPTVKPLSGPFSSSKGGKARSHCTEEVVAIAREVEGYAGKLGVEGVGLIARASRSQRLRGNVRCLTYWRAIGSELYYQCLVTPTGCKALVAWSLHSQLWTLQEEVMFRCIKQTPA